jgi:hypothetical protein
MKYLKYARGSGVQVGLNMVRGERCMVRHRCDLAGRQSVPVRQAGSLADTSAGALGSTGVVGAGISPGTSVLQVPQENAPGRPGRHDNRRRDGLAKPLLSRRGTLPVVLAAGTATLQQTAKQGSPWKSASWSKRLANVNTGVSLETEREIFGCWEMVHLRGETTLARAQHNQQPTMDTPP